VHELKIDKLFVQNMHASAGDLQIVRAIVDLAHAFGLTTIAEGVEDAPQLETLRALGCDVVQGFLFGKAMPEGDFVAWAQRKVQPQTAPRREE
jgi:EAL domain-containing protein (putative c-di-GMP-specific phosphodiesterase class I)